ncbi:hypothetical protein BS47DRAFT_1396172 [Hydnum rufescens UP504]|uniref:Uncharacterized protein n=1 Tax=Hydnum rufescens UP504 TaxID=1448309 RepID=A0A9P6DQP7_9AGAM|nr:hypothetical protein BS47DRAFT_1396172 [Hydnum rufescens UP504]
MHGFLRIPSPSRALSPHRSLNPVHVRICIHVPLLVLKWVLDSPCILVHILDLPCILVDVLNLPYILAVVLFSPTFPHTSSISLAFPHASSISPTFSHTSSLPLTFPDMSTIPIAFSHMPPSPPTPKRIIIIIKNTIILWVPHSLINGLQGLQRGGSQPVHGHALVLLQQLSALHVVITMTGGVNFMFNPLASHGGELNRSSHGGAPTGPNATFSVSGPTQPISGWVGTTTSSAVAKGSHVNLTSSFQSIPLGRWFAIVAGPLPNDSFHDIQLWLDVYPQVIVVHREQQKSSPVSSSSTRAQVPPVDPFSPTSPPSNSFKPPSSPLPGPSDPFDSMTEGTTVRGAEDRDLEEEENHGDTSDVIHHGGRFSIDQIKWAHVKCEEFFAELDAKAKESNQSLESVRRIALAISPSKMLRNGNAWNAFQALYKKDHPNTDPSVSARDYMVNMVQPGICTAHQILRRRGIPEWAMEAAQLIAEHESAKVGATKLVTQSGGDIAWIMANQKDKWTHDMQWLATMDIHTMFLMVTGNAASPAAHAQNKCCLGSEEMAAWYNSNFMMSTQLANIYQFILSCHSRYAELDQFNEEQGKRKHDEDLSTMYKTRTAIKDTLIGLFSPFVKMTKFPWTNLAKVLVQNKLIISNFVPNDKFPNFGTSLSDLHTTNQYKTLYYALKESSPEKKIVITKWITGQLRS